MGGCHSNWLSKVYNLYCVIEILWRVPVCPILDNMLFVWIVYHIQLICFMILVQKLRQIENGLLKRYPEHHLLLDDQL